VKCSNCSANVKWVVAIDVDGTMAKYHRAYRDFLILYDNRVSWQTPNTWTGLGEFRDVFGLTQHEHHERKLAFRAGGFKRWMDKFDSAGWMMKRLQQMGLEVWVTTTRPWMRMDNVDRDTLEWLRRWDIPFDHLLFDEDKYGRLMELVDPERILLVLDDENEQIQRCEELALPAVLHRSEWNTEVEALVEVRHLADVEFLVSDRMVMRDALSH
jgi:hypothetical protein